MAKTKITALTELTDTNIAIGDLIPIVDISDTSQAASGTTKKVTITSLATAVASAFSGDSPTFVNLNTTGTTTLGDSADATTVNGTLGVTGATTLTGGLVFGTANVTDGDTTPSVAGKNVFFINNSAPTTITNFTGGVAGQIIYIYFYDASTTVNRNNAYLAGGNNFISTSGDILVLLYNNPYWYEISRSANF